MNVIVPASKSSTSAGTTKLEPDEKNAAPGIQTSSSLRSMFGIPSEIGNLRPVSGQTCENIFGL